MCQASAGRLKETEMKEDKIESPEEAINREPFPELQEALDQQRQDDPEGFREALFKLMEKKSSE